jgi:predicted amidohydrolase
LFFLAPPFVKFAYTAFSGLAREYGIYLMAGSFPTVVGERVTNRAALFAPDGSLLGVQDKVHLMPRETKEGISAGDRFHVFATEAGRLAMPVCMDATYFETFRLLAAGGAEIVLLPIADAQNYNYWLALRGIWPRVQESLVYGVKAALVGEFLGETFTGKAGVFAPLELTPGRDGVLAEASGHDREALVTAEVDLEALQELRRNHPYLGDRNPELERRYFPGIYTKYK